MIIKWLSNTNQFFLGDTLFSAGCGRLFEGTPEQMNTSLNVTLGSLPDDTVTNLLYSTLLDHSIDYFFFFFSEFIVVMNTL